MPEPAPREREQDKQAEQSTEVEDELWTVAASRYWEASMHPVDFVTFTAGLVDYSDEVVQRAARTLAALERDEKKKAELEGRASATPRWDQFSQWARWLSEVVLTRSVDNLLTYISDAHFLVYTERPEALRSGEQVKLDFVLRHESMNDLLAALAERRVDRLAYKGLLDVSEELAKSLGLSLFPNKEVEAAAVLAVDQRNLIVHNRGIINARWVARHGDDQGPLGAPLRFDNPIDTLTRLNEVVRHLDPQIASKFGVPQSTPAVRGL